MFSSQPRQVRTDTIGTLNKTKNIFNFQLSSLIYHLFFQLHTPNSSFSTFHFQFSTLLYPLSSLSLPAYILRSGFYKPFFSKNHQNNSNNYHSHRNQFCLRRLPTENIVFGIYSYFFNQKSFYTIKY